MLKDEDLKQHLCDFRDLLQKEIEILSPTMIVCTNQHIYDFVIELYPHDELLCIGKEHNSIRFHVPTGTLILCSYHPSSFTKSPNEIYEGVMYHYRAYLNL